MNSCNQIVYNALKRRWIEKGLFDVEKFLIAISYLKSIGYTSEEYQKYLEDLDVLNKDLENKFQKK